MYARFSRRRRCSCGVEALRSTVSSAVQDQQNGPASKRRDDHLGQMLHMLPVTGLRSWHGSSILSHVQGDKSLERAMIR